MTVTTQNWQGGEGREERGGGKVTFGSKVNNAMCYFEKVECTLSFHFGQLR